MFSESTCSAHHAEGLVNPKVRAKKTVTDFRYPRACRFRKHQILSRSPDLAQLYFIKCGSNWQKLTKNGIFDFFEKSHFLNVIVLKLF
jgi:hypothetical protein